MSSQTHALPGAAGASTGDAAADAIAALLVARLRDGAARLRTVFGSPDPARIRCCWLDDVLPDELAAPAHLALPPLSAMVRRQNSKERKFVSADLDALQPALRSLVAAFARQEVADAVAGIMGLPRLEADPLLYNGGITAMLPGDYMSPHLDNSHDYDRVRRRAVVVLYYLSPDWQEEHGGGLELWDRPHRASPRPIGCRYNRLVIMETTDRSWHSIRPVLGDRPRISLTTYFYAPAAEAARLRLTRFTGFPGQNWRSLVFGAEFRIRSMVVRMTRGRRVAANRHAWRPPAVTRTDVSS